MAQVITLAGERLFALKAQNNQQLDIDTFIFAFVPGQDSSAPIDRNEGLPPIGQRVHTQIVQQTGLINENAVVYSSVLDSLTGPFDFNWVGLYSSVNQTLIAIIHTPTVSKTVTVPGAAGNILNRNFVIEYSGIAELTGITVDAETWQIDYTARLNGMDELTRQLAADMNGKDWFIGNGFKVVPRSTLNTFKVTAGVGYVSGLRVTLAADHILTLSSYPQFVYVDAWFDGTSESVWKGHTAFTVTNTEMDDYIDVNGRNHYVFKLASITAADAIQDMRVNSLQNKHQIIQGEAAPAYNIQLINQDSESTDRRIIAIIARVLYADSSTALYQSLDMGDTWQLVRSKAGRWLKMLKCSDGEILIISGGTDVQKSSGWATNRATATFSTVLTFPVNTGVLRWSIDGDGTKFICTHYENGGTRADVRYVYISTNSGNTWTLVWDSVARFGPTDANLSHLHAVCYDQKNNRFWICEGHLDLGVFYSENDGSTWTRFEDQDFYTESTPTTMTPTPYGIVAGTDTFPNGIHLIKGDLASTLKPEVAYIYRSDGAGTQLQADAAVTDPDTGLVYIAARGFASPAKSVIMCSNGESASIIYESETNDAIFNLAVMDGKLIAHQSGTPYKTIKGRVSIIGSKQPLFDAGNIVTENIVPNLSMALGKGSDAKALNSMASGRNTKVGTVGGQDLIAEGPNNLIEGGSKNILVGGNNNLTGTTSNTVCYSWGVTLHNLSNVTLMGIGANTTSSNSVTFGANAITEGANSTTTGTGAHSTAGNAATYGFNSVAALLSCSFGSGCSVDVTGGCGFGYGVTIGGSNGSGFGRGATVNTGVTNGTSIGALSIVAHANAAAIGVSTATQRADSVCVGPRDIESTKIGARLLFKSPDGTLYAIAVANGGTLTITAV